MIKAIVLCTFILSHMAIANIHEDWDALLKKHVTVINNGHTSVVDYTGFVSDKQRLSRYLFSLSELSPQTFETWSREEKIAFLINAHNAFSINLILPHYPNIESTRDLGNFLAPIESNDSIYFLGKTFNLAEIEKKLLDVESPLFDPKHYLAINGHCVSCPMLRNEAYNDELLEQQLNDQTLRFLTDRSKNFIEGNTLFLSALFNWNRQVFQPSFFLQYTDALGLNEEQIQKLEAKKLRIRYLQFDWLLNKSD